MLIAYDDTLRILKIEGSEIKIVNTFTGYQARELYRTLIGLTTEDDLK